MARARYLVSTKKPGLEFRVVRAVAIDPNKPGEVRATLIGAHGVMFDKLINQELLEKYGYRIEVREDASNPVPPA